VAADGKGNVYIADFLNSRVRKVSRDGTITTIAGTGREGDFGDGGPATSAQLSRPEGVAVDVRGNVYVADTHNNRVRKVSAGQAPADSRRCSKATARSVAERFRLAAPGSQDSVARVLCGPLAGPGSRAMAVAVTPGTCGINGWAVFEFTGGAWQLVGARQTGWVMDIAVVGSAIRETAPVPTGEFRCPTSGNARTRIWHWNGSRLVAGPWKQEAPGSSTPSSPGAFKSGYFKTPSGNIVCFYSPGPVDRPQAFLACGIKSGLKPAPPRRPCQDGGYAGDRVTLLPTGRVNVPSCAGDPGALVGEREASVLGYGKSWSGGGLRCTSAADGLTCRNKSGHGFFLSRENWRAF
jgi:hypothetical protein